MLKFCEMAILIIILRIFALKVDHIFALINQIIDTILTWEKIKTIK